MYSFDPYNTPALNVRFAPGQQLLRIPLQLQSDAAFIHRGLKLNSSLPSFLGVQLFFPDDTPLTDDIVSVSAFTSGTGNPAPILEPEIMSPAGASYQLNVVNLSATQSAMALLPNVAPVLVDPVGFGHGPVVGNNIPAANAFGPFLYNGGLYMALTPTVGTFLLQIFQSLDGGTTWVHIGAVGEPNGNAMPVFDGDHTIVVAFSTAAIGTNGDLNLINFDLSTLTWGAAYGTAGEPTTQAVYDVYIRPDGSILVLHNPEVNGGGGVSGLSASVYAAGVWTTFDAGANVLTLPDYSNADDIVVWSSAVLDPVTGNLLVFFQTEGDVGPPSFQGRVFFQLIAADNSLGTFNDFGTTLIFSVDSTTPVIVGANVVLAYVAFGAPVFPGLLYGTPLTAPAFASVGSPGIDPAALNVAVPASAPYLAFDGQTLFAIYVASANGNTANQLRLCYLNGLV